MQHNNFFIVVVNFKVATTNIVLFVQFKTSAGTNISSKEEPS